MWGGEASWHLTSLLTKVSWGEGMTGVEMIEADIEEGVMSDIWINESLGVLHSSAQQSTATCTALLYPSLI